LFGSRAVAANAAATRKGYINMSIGIHRIVRLIVASDLAVKID